VTPDLDLLRRLVVLLLALLPPAVAVWTLRGQEFDQAAPFRSEKPLIEPAGYAFVIWRLIFLGVLGFGIYQLVAPGASAPWIRELSFPATAAFVFTAVWLLVARAGLLWGTVAAVTGLLAALGVGLLRLTAAGPDVPALEYLLVIAPLSLYAGWVTAAFFVNLAAAAKESGWFRDGAAERRWSVALLAVAVGLVVGVVLASGGNWGYAGGAAWALVAVTVGNRQRPEGSPAVGAMAAGGLGVVVLVQAWSAFGAS